MLWGMVLAVLHYYPLYGLMAAFAPKDTGQPFRFPYIGYNAVMLSIRGLLQVYGPIAAFLVELFPTMIRYTSISLPCHIGNGVFGGLVPIIGLSLLTETANNYAGLWYPMAVADVCALICYSKLSKTFHGDIESDASVANLGAKTAPAATGDD